MRTLFANVFISKSRSTSGQDVLGFRILHRSSIFLVLDLFEERFPERSEIHFHQWFLGTVGEYYETCNSGVACKVSLFSYIRTKSWLLRSIILPRGEPIVNVYHLWPLDMLLANLVGFVTDLMRGENLYRRL